MSARTSAPSHPSGAAAPERLPGFAAGRVSEIQRARILDAMARVCTERGAGNVTVAGIVERAGVSRRTFYEQFSDREDCLLAAIDDALKRAGTPVLAAYHSSGDWRERMRSCLIALLRFLEEDPFAGYLIVVETLGSGVPALERRRRVLEQVTAAVDEGRAQAKSCDPPALAAEGVVGGVLVVLHDRVREAGPLTELTGQLMSIVTLPYLGAAAARRELGRPMPEPAPRPSASSAGEPGVLRLPEMRLTYRTVSLLASVAANPGASNRDLSRAAGIQDQGQISKLLTRLERLELIENGSVRRGGTPNAWSLTGKGEEIHRAVGERANAMMVGREVA